MARKHIFVSLFTCIVIRAVHLEWVSNMTVERFLLVLRRIIARSRRGRWGIIWSDNPKTLKGAKKEFEKCWRIEDDDQTQVDLPEKKIMWKFLVERAPWWAGFMNVWREASRLL